MFFFDEVFRSKNNPASSEPYCENFISVNLVTSFLQFKQFLTIFVSFLLIAFSIVFPNKLQVIVLGRFPPNIFPLALALKFVFGSIYAPNIGSCLKPLTLFNSAILIPFFM